jgi:putative oxidoreductase
MITKFLFSKTDVFSTFSSNFGVLLLRGFAGITMAFAHGMGKIPPNEQFIGFIESLGLPYPFILAWMAAMAEFLGGIFVALGILTRPAAFTVMITMFIAAFMAHANDPFLKKEFALLYFFVFMFFFLAGPGKLSLDHIVNKKKY